MRRSRRSTLRSLTLIDIAAGVAAAAGTAAISVAPAAAQGLTAPSWTGFYFGAHTGYRFGNAKFTSAPYTLDPNGPGPDPDVITFPGRSDSFNPNGILIGTHLGYNYQVSNTLVGWEIDWTWGSGKDNVFAQITGVDVDADGFTLRRNSEVSLTWQSTIRARAGYVMNMSLWYVTGGVAFARAKWTDSSQIFDEFGTAAGSAVWNASKTMTGFVVGAGFEQMLSSNWIWRVEYLYESFGDFNVPHGFSSQTGTLDIDVHKVRVGLSFKG
jgi:outer membrane immunogenic protein